MKGKCGLLKINPNTRCPLLKESRITQIGDHLVPQRYKKILKVKTVSTYPHILGFVHLVSLMPFGSIRDSISQSLSSRSVLSNKASFMQFEVIWSVKLVSKVKCAVMPRFCQVLEMELILALNVLDSSYKFFELKIN